MTDTEDSNSTSTSTTGTPTEPHKQHTEKPQTDTQAEGQTHADDRQLGEQNARADGAGDSVQMSNNNHSAQALTMRRQRTDV